MKTSQIAQDFYTLQIFERREVNSLVYDCISNLYNMRSIASVIVFDILLGIVHIFLDLYLAHSYFENTDVWWGVLTLLIIAVPGTMGKGVFNRSIVETCQEVNKSLHCTCSVPILELDRVVFYICSIFRARLRQIFFLLL